MLSTSNSQISPSYKPKVAPIANILPANTPMPLECDACDHEQSYSMHHLRELPELTCKNCGDQRSFSSFELVALENALKGMGYYLSKSI